MYRETLLHIFKGLLITLVLFQVFNIDVNFMTVTGLTLLKDILFHALITHILGAILADKALQVQIFLYVIFLGVFNCCNQFFPLYL
jgi:hypothetical protein